MIHEDEANVGSDILHLWPSLALVNCINTAITWLLQMHFSTIISNPPFQKVLPQRFWNTNKYFPKMVQPITVYPQAGGEDYVLVSEAIALLASKKEINSNVSLPSLEFSTGAVDDTD